MFGIRCGGEIYKKSGFCNWVSLFCGVLLCILVVGSFTGCGKVSENSEESGRVEKTEETSKEKKPTTDEAKTDTSQKNEETKDNEPIEDVEIIELQDPLVERCVRITLGKVYGEKITSKDCTSIKKLLIDCDLDVGINFSGVQLCGTVANYVDLCDLKYFTELEELIIDNNTDRDMIVNMDAIKNCTKLKRLSMKHHIDLYRAEMFQTGYKYIADIVQALPELEYLDLGYKVSQEYKELIAGSNQKLIFEDKVNWLDVDNRIQINSIILRADDKWKDEEIAEYADAWTYGYNPGQQTVRAEIYADSRESLESSINYLPKTTEDVYVSYGGQETIDMSIFARFDKLKTLTIDNSFFYMEDYNAMVVRVENIENLANNTELFSLNFCGVVCEFDALKELTQLKELSIHTCIVDTLDFLTELKDLRELTLLYNIMPSSEDFFVNNGSKMTALRFLRIEDSNTLNYNGIYTIPALETLSVKDRVGVTYEFDAISKCKTLKNMELYNRQEYELHLEGLEGIEGLQFLLISNDTELDNISGVGKILSLPSLVSFWLSASIEEKNVNHSEFDKWVYMAVQHPNISFFSVGGSISETKMYHVISGNLTLGECLAEYKDYYRELFEAGIVCRGYDYLMLRYPEYYYDSAQIQAELNR